MPTISLTTAANVAAQFLGVLDSGESLSSQQLNDAQGAANNMLENWTNEQTSFLRQALTAFTLAGGTYTAGTLLQFPDATTPLNIPAGYLRAIELNLALELAAQYDVDPSAALIRQAAEARAAACPFIARYQSTPDPFGVAAAAQAG